MALSRLNELAAAVENTPGTTFGPGFYAAGNAKHLVLNPTVSFDVPLFTRQIGRSSLTPLPGVSGIKTGTVSFQLELAGHADATPDVPTWDLFMRGCGFRSAATTYVAFTGASGVLRHGEIVTISGTGASGTATVVHDTWPTSTGTGTLYLVEDLGTVTWATSGASTVTGGTTGETVTVGAGVTSADAGQSWWPVSQPTVKIEGGATTGSLSVGNILVMSNGTTDEQIAGVITKIDSVADDIWVRMYTGFPAATSGYKFHKSGESASSPSNFYLMTSATVTQDDVPTLSLALNQDGVAQVINGARGTWSLDARIGEPALMSFEFTGGVSSVSDLALLTGVTYETKVPPVFLGATLTLGTEADGDTDDEVTPCINALNIAANNETTPRTCVNEASGISTVEITGRGFTGSIDPEQELEATYSLIQNFLDGDIMRLGATIGSVAANKFKVSMPGLQATSVGGGDRGGIRTRDYQFQATGGSWTNASDTYGGDNELVITYLLV